MAELSPDIFEKGPKMEFNDPQEAISFLVDLMNKDRNSLQVVFKKFFENDIRLYAQILEFQRLLCDQLESTYGLKIDFKALIEAARVNVDQDWPATKGEIAELLELSKQVDDVFKKDSN
ncbi:MAG: hypothetical protein HZA28_05145 [Candidatus Omnitrophica bacterium]|nr:hypothetical protein [Candidatus Omnitrophota bacterium]